MDEWFGTKPWLILIFFVGVIVGILNVIKSAKNIKIVYRDKMALNPMYQFNVYRIGPVKIGEIDLSFTNASLFMV